MANALAFSRKSAVHLFLRFKIYIMLRQTWSLGWPSQPSDMPLPTQKTCLRTDGNKANVSAVATFRKHHCL